MKKLKVMLVDDEFMILEGMKKLFDWSAYGCEVICTASDGMEAVNMANEYNPQIVVMDINLPIISGLDAIRMIQQKHGDTAFIVVSGYEEFEYCREALHLKVVDYILKPVDFIAFGIIIDKIKMTLLQEEKTIGNIKDTIEAENGKEKLIYQIVEYINHHISQEISLQVLAEEFHLNPAYISQMFKNETGIKYYDYLTQLRINKAKLLLTTTDMNVTEIAMEVGFNNYRIFSKIFKNNTGQLPSHFGKAKPN